MQHARDVRSNAVGRPRARTAVGPAGYAVIETLCGKRIILAKPENVIARLLEVAEEIRLVRPQEIIQAAMTAYAGWPSRQHAAARRATDWVLDMAICKARPLTRQAIEVGRFGYRVSVARQRVGAHLVRHEEHDVWALTQRAAVLALGNTKLTRGRFLSIQGRSEEHTSELQSHVNLVCRLLL